MRDHPRFAVCILLPGTSDLDAVHAATFHHVHILDKQSFNPDKDYSCYRELRTPPNCPEIFPLFIFPGESELIEDSDTLNAAVEKSKKLSGLP